ncbi:hypothetical protein [Xylophilus ampelinus]|uniref:Prevent-host-death family protein n=1 Tax=Xylophilus ampelinus TaxID=54067 RepID=A0A318SK78_9BURK|nr:hypothetical protein [Xylophilus ampelinus]MCS4511127.1 hypothetical protein [Xylophilus ampelinus]PYE75882.1 hypothetical protein DFQ15_1187 [Xylophilus ampelinus]
MKTVQLIETNGRREYAVVPIDLWERFADRAEDLEDKLLFDRARAADDGTRIPGDVRAAELSGNHPVKA